MKNKLLAGLPETIKIRVSYDIAGLYGFQYQWDLWPDKIDAQNHIDIEGGLYLIDDKPVGQLGSKPINIENRDGIWYALPPIQVKK